MTEAGEQVISDNPMLGVSARIVENYARSDGKFYPAACSTCWAPWTPHSAIGSWQPVDMCNGGQVVIDLSAAWLASPARAATWPHRRSAPGSACSDGVTRPVARR